MTSVFEVLCSVLVVFFPSNLPGRPSMASGRSCKSVGLRGQLACGRRSSANADPAAATPHKTMYVKNLTALYPRSMTAGVLYIYIYVYYICRCVNMCIFTQILPQVKICWVSGVAPSPFRKVEAPPRRKTVDRHGFATPWHFRGRAGPREAGAWSTKWSINLGP